MNAKEDHRLHGQMTRAFRALEARGADGQAAFRSLLLDESPHVRSWVAAQMLSQGESSARFVLEHSFARILVCSGVRPRWCLSSISVARSLRRSVKVAPNMRVQRTRVLLPAVARRSPLTRRPLGGTGWRTTVWL
jgi:hypothetical protein